MHIRRNVFVLTFLLPLLGACDGNDFAREAEAIPSDQCFDPMTPGAMEELAAKMEQSVCVRGWATHFPNVAFLTYLLFDEIWTSGEGFIFVDLDIYEAIDMGFFPEDQIDAEHRLRQFVEIRGRLTTVPGSIGQCDEDYCGTALIVPSSIRHVAPDAPPPYLEALPEWAIRECYDADHRETWDRMVAEQPESSCIYGHLEFLGHSGHFDLDGRPPPYSPDGPPLRYIYLQFEWSEAWDWGLIDRQRLLAEGEDFPLVLARFERWDLGCRVDDCRGITLRPTEMWRIEEPAP